VVWRGEVGKGRDGKGLNGSLEFRVTRGLHYGVELVCGGISEAKRNLDREARVR